MASYREDGSEAMKPVGETAYIHALATDCAEDSERDLACAAAIIGYVDLGLGNAATAVLDAHREASPAHFRGTRHGVGWDEHPEVTDSHTEP